MKQKKTIILLLQFILVVGSIVGIVLYMNSKTATTDVYMFTRNFTENNVIITEGDVRAVAIPSPAVTSGMETNLENIIGKFAVQGASTGQYVYKSQLIDEAEKSIFDTMDLSEYRLISLPIDMVQGLSGRLRKGDAVDLVFTGKGKKQGDNLYADSEFTYSNIFLQEVLVYSVNTADGFLFEGYSDMKSLDFIDADGEPIDAEQLGIITLAVTQSQAAQIYARREVGVVSILGRFETSENLEPTGYIIGEHGPIYTGEGVVELDGSGDSAEDKEPSESNGSISLGEEVITEELVEP